MKSLILILTLISLPVAKGASLFPSPPEGWVEMNSLEPIALTWVKALPQQKLTDVPTLMVQVYPKSEKLEKLFKDRRLFEYADKEWKQIWFMKSDEVFVLLSKNEDEDLLIKKKVLQSWIETHD